MRAINIPSVPPIKRPILPNSAVKTARKTKVLNKLDMAEISLKGAVVGHPASEDDRYQYQD